MPELHYPSMHFLAVLALVALVSVAPPAHADDAAVPRIRRDLIAVRLTPEASAALAAPASPRAAGAARTLAVPRGGFGLLALRLGLTLEPAFPAAAAPRGATRVNANAERSEVEQRLARRWLVHLPAGLSPEQAIEQLRGDPSVETAEPVHLVPVESTPNDSLWSKAYYFYQPSRRDMHAPEAWDITTGDSSQIIAIIDTGVLLTHPDLAGPGPGIGGNIWTNAREAAGLPGVDDDGNGYIDDVHGWDFVALPDTGFAVPGEDWRDEDNDPNDYTGHGTGVAGIAAAITNNRIGVAGTAGSARIMPLRVGYSALTQQSGLVDESAAARAIVYAVRTGATVLNCSFSSVPQSDMTDALDLAQAAGVVVVVAAGNNGSAHAMADRAEVISVGAVDKDDKLTLFTNTGPYVDLCAAGLFVSTTTLDRDAEADSAHRCRPAYSATASGTSFSSPIGSGAVALLQADRHARGLAPLRPAEVRLRLVETADSIVTQNPTASGYGSGRLNLLRMLTDPPGSAAIWLGGVAVGTPAVTAPASGAASVFIGTQNAHLLHIDGSTRAVTWDVALPAAAAGSPAAADMGGTVGTACFIATTDQHVCGFDAAGNALPGWPRVASRPAEGLASPALADLDGDGVLEVVWGDGQGNVWAWHADGAVLPGFPVNVGPVTSGVWIALADLDGDGAAEIIAAPARGRITVLDANGQALPGWPAAPVDDLFLQHPPVVALLADSPLPSIIATETTSLESSVRVLNLDGTTRRFGHLDGLVGGSTAAADVDGDGQMDIVVYCANGDLKFCYGAATGWTTVPVHANGVPGSLTPEMIVGRHNQGGAALDWSVDGEVREYSGTRHALANTVRIGDGTPTFVDLNGDGSLELLSAGSADRSLFVYPTRTPVGNNAAMWPTARGNAARTGNAIPAGTPLPDRMPPRAIANLRLERIGDGTADVSWSAPFGGLRRRVARYEARRSATSPTAATFALGAVISGVPTPGAAGRREIFSLNGITANSVVYVALTSTDSAGNVSAISNVVRIPTLVAGVTNLRAIRADTTSIDIAWGATGNTGREGQAASYDVRASRQAITATNFDVAEFQQRLTASRPAAEAEAFQLTGLRAGKRYFVAVRAVDSLGLVSPLSNVLTVSTVPGVPPVAVPGLRLTRRSSARIELAWRSTGTSGANGQAAAYEFRASRQLITPANFDLAEVQRRIPATQPAGQLEHAALDSLSGDAGYWIAVRAVDSLGFASPLSDVVSGATMPKAISDLHVTATDTTLVSVAWTATMSANDVAHGVVYDMAATRRPLDEAGFDAAEVHRVIGGSSSGSLSVTSLDSLADGSRYSIAVRMRDPDGNTSAISNIAVAVTRPKFPPRAATGLRVATLASTTVDLAWVSTGSHGRRGEAAEYDVHASRQPMDARGFELAEIQVRVPATSAVGEQQHGALANLLPHTHYWVAVRAIDSLGFLSAISDPLELTTNEPLAPVRVTDLRVSSAGTTQLELVWTSIGNSGHDGQATRYELRSSDRPIDANNFDQAAQLRTLSATLAMGLEARISYSQLETGKRYWFALRSVDALGLKSPVSNIISIVPGPLAGTTRAGIAVGRIAGGAKLFWNVDVASSGYAARIRILDINGRVCRNIVVPGTSDGVMVWDGRSDAGNAAPPGIYFARLETRFAGAQTKLLLLP